MQFRLPAAILVLAALTAWADTSEDWYHRFRQRTGMAEDDNDRILFRAGAPFTASGLVRDAADGLPVAGARVRGDGVDTATGKDGRFSYRARPGVPAAFEVGAPGFATRRLALAPAAALEEPDILLTRTAETTLRAGETVTAWATGGRCRLTISARVLVRADGRPPRFPVTVRLAYIEPDERLLAMPGQDMLARDGGRDAAGVAPLLSWGAAVPEAVDADGALLAVSPALVRSTRLVPRLEFRVPGAAGFSLWQLGRDALWTKDPRPVKTERDTGDQNEDPWKTKAIVDNVELTAWNLDKMAVAAAVAWTITPPDARRFEAVVTGTLDGGTFCAARVFNSAGKPCQLRLLVPAGALLELKIYTERDRLRQKLVKPYRAPGDTSTYRFAADGRLVRQDGKEPAWQHLGNVSF